MTAERRAVLAGAVEAAIAAARLAAPAGTDVVAIGWATVDLERAEREFGSTFADAPSDRWLGARCRVAPDAFSLPLVLLEPTTEGRLAGALARLGEGAVATWFEARTPGSSVDGAASPGPFGSEWPLPSDRPDGRARFIVDTRTGTMPA